MAYGTFSYCILNNKWDSVRVEKFSSGSNIMNKCNNNNNNKIYLFYLDLFSNSLNLTIQSYCRELSINIASNVWQK